MVLERVIRTLPVPGTTPRGIAFDGRSLWLLDSAAVTLYQLSIASGTIIRSMVVPDATTISSIAFDGRLLWISDFGNDLFIQLDPQNNKIVRSFGALPSSLNLINMGFDGHYIYSGTGAVIYVLGINSGTLIRTLNLDAGTSCRQIALTGNTTAWVTDTTSDIIIEVSLEDGRTIRSFTAPSTEPAGLTFDGVNLWHTDFTGDLIYQISVT